MTEPKKAAPAKGAAPRDRIEEYDAVRPDGSVVRVRHNIETGETQIIR